MTQEEYIKLINAKMDAEVAAAKAAAAEAPKSQDKLKERIEQIKTYIQTKEQMLQAENEKFILAKMDAEAAAKAAKAQEKLKEAIEQMKNLINPKEILREHIQTNIHAKEQTLQAEYNKLIHAKMDAAEAPKAPSVVEN